MIFLFYFKCQSIFPSYIYLLYPFYFSSLYSKKMYRCLPLCNCSSLHPTFSINYLQLIDYSLTFSGLTCVPYLFIVLHHVDGTNTNTTYTLVPHLYCTFGWISVENGKVFSSVVIYFILSFAGETISLSICHLLITVGLAYPVIDLYSYHLMLRLSFSWEKNVTILITHISRVIQF